MYESNSPTVAKTYPPVESIIIAEIRELDARISTMNQARYPNCAKLCELYGDRDVLTKALIQIRRKESRIPC